MVVLWLEGYQVEQRKFEGQLSWSSQIHEQTDQEKDSGLMKTTIAMCQEADIHLSPVPLCAIQDLSRILSRDEKRVFTPDASRRDAAGAGLIAPASSAI
ncbi:hypothetical protein EYF80_011877 [Liparis tanakae]|uniref:Uncharacterized protein n=1 Tax=Liparis tanakae TaxID=230148 RepID=A0A4Z2IIJ5_9TELE|nr:hypothetical protein EYF80_011877 [Liparis tanakae]